MEKIIPSAQLRSILEKIDRRSYPAYKDTKGMYRFSDYVLSIDHVQGDPFASPSRLNIVLRGEKAGFPAHLYSTKERKTALEDELLRQFGRCLGERRSGAKGSGKSGLLFVSHPGQEVLTRSAVHVDEKTGDIRIRFAAGFPANGRTINAQELIRILFTYLPDVIRNSLYYAVFDRGKLEKIAELADDQAFLRRSLRENGLVAFVANGSVLPRESGVCDRPMKQAVPFESPSEMTVCFSLPSGREISGMGIRRGITLIIGGGYHGKSTLLEALERGVYNHRGGDGREYVVTDDTAVKLRAEDGRSIKQTDISMFINDLPNKKDTKHFCTEDASGSTSQAASVVEALEAGARTFLIDEDTSATNFMIRDELMGLVIDSSSEPITPFIARIRQLYDKEGVSTIVVAGSSGSYFHVADSVIQMQQYRPLDVTEKAKRAAREFELPRTEAPAFSGPDFSRRPSANRSLVKDGRLKIRTNGMDGISLNKEVIDVRYLEQLVDPEQLVYLAHCMTYIEKNMFDGKKTIRECVEALFCKIEEGGEGVLFAPGATIPDMALPRRQELYACLNRYRGLRL